MAILTKRPKGMTRQDWKQYNRDLKIEIRNKKSRAIWFAKGVPVFDVSGKTILSYIVQPMGTYRRGMQTL